jgi:hypothetical protein
MRYAQQNALLHNQRMLEMQRRELEEQIQQIREDQPKKLNGQGEAEVVATASLAPVLKHWREIWEREYGPENLHLTDNLFIGPIGYLAEQSGVNRRQINAIMRQEWKYCSVTKAEKLLMAIDREYMLATGEVPIIPSPYWSMEKWTKYMDSRGCTTDGS